MAFSSSITASRPDYNVPSAGDDGISSLSWSPAANFLISTNWDGKVRCWEVQEQGGNLNAIPKAQVNHENNAPVLCSTFSPDGSTVFTAGTDKAVRMWKLGQQPLNNAPPPQIGSHQAPIKTIGFLSSSNLVVTGGWDNKLNFWDSRSPNPVGNLDLPDKCYSMDVRGNCMVVATANRHVLVYDVSGQPREFLRKESPLKYQTRCVSVFPDMSGFAIGSIEGRVGIQYIDKAQEKNNFAFKCHRQDAVAFPVNDIAFHPIGTFATVGGDGVVSFWDKDNKQKLKGFSPISKPIPCAKFNAAGNIFAYAGSYDWSKGHSFYTPGQPDGNQILLHYTTEDEIKPKKKR